MNNLPGVTYAMPVLNEERHVAAAIASIQAQDYPGPAEIMIILGRSTDRTDEIVAQIAEHDPRIRTIANPSNDVPTGLNRAIQAAAHPVIVRVDAHSELPPGYTERAVRTLVDTGAANVGGVMVARGSSGLQAAVARAYNSRLGLGGGAYHSATAEAGPAESAYLGVMRVDALRDVGYFDVTLRRGQDWELNHRLRKAGHLVWLDPALQVDYWPRASLRDLWRQMYVTGVWRGEIVRRLGRRNSARYFAPPALVLATVLAVLLNVPDLVLSPFFDVPVLDWAARVALAGPALYAVVLLAACARTAGTVLDRLRFAAVLATIHQAWGAGFIRGVLRGARGAVDRSRVLVMERSAHDRADLSPIRRRRLPAMPHKGAGEGADIVEPHR